MMDEVLCEPTPWRMILLSLPKTVPGNEMQLFISTGSLWNLEQALPSSSKEYRPGDQSRDDGGGGTGENAQ